MKPVSWETHRRTAIDIISRPAKLKIILKTKDDPFFLERWIAHHARIVSEENLIIFDNISADPGVIKTYEDRPHLPVFTFSGMHNNIHDWEMQRDLYDALHKASKHFCFLDTDEFLGAIIDNHWVADESILSFLRPGEAAPATWLFNAAGSDRIFEVKDVNELEQGLLWGKPLLPSPPSMAGILTHSVQYDPNIFKSARAINFFILHLKNLDREQRIQANIKKLKSRGIIPADATEETVRHRGVKPDDSYNVRLYLKEAHQLLSEGAPMAPSAPAENQMEIQRNGAIKFGSAKARATFDQHILNGRTIYERIAEGHQQAKKAGLVLEIKRALSFRTHMSPTKQRVSPTEQAAPFLPHMSATEQSVYRSALQKSRRIIEFGTGGSTFMALASSSVQSITSIESDVSWILKLRQEQKVIEAESSGRLSLHWSDVGPVGNWGHPSDERYRIKWPSYSMIYWQPWDPFDLALIDGRFRVACALQAALNGCPVIVFHDFWNRPQYHGVLAVLDPIERADTLAVLVPKAKFDQTMAQSIYENFKYNPN